MEGTAYVLVLQEVELHPHSYLSKLEGAFETPSIAHIHSKDGLKRYTFPPVYDAKYLVLFESFKVFEANLAFIHLDFMFPVVLCSSKSQSEDARYLCLEKKIPCRTFVNQFAKEDATDLIRDLATEEVSDSFCKTLITRVGLSPRRIVSAMMVCEQVGYSTSNISKYVDKHSYIDIYDVIESLLGICSSGAQMKRACLYIHQNRLWYRKFTKQALIKEAELLLKLYQDITQGILTEYTMREYIEQERVSRYRVLYAFDLYGRVSYVSLLGLKQFLEQAGILEVALQLS